MHYRICVNGSVHVVSVKFYHAPYKTVISKSWSSDSMQLYQHLQRKNVKSKSLNSIKPPHTYHSNLLKHKKSIWCFYTEITLTVDHLQTIFAALTFEEVERTGEYKVEQAYSYVAPSTSVIYYSSLLNGKLHQSSFILATNQSSHWTTCEYDLYQLV